MKHQMLQDLHKQIQREIIIALYFRPKGISLFSQFLYYPIQPKELSHSLIGLMDCQSYFHRLIQANLLSTKDVNFKKSLENHYNSRRFFHSYLFEIGEDLYDEGWDPYAIYIQQPYSILGIRNVAKSLQNDDIDQLQLLVSETQKFDFNAKINFPKTFKLGVSDYFSRDIDFVTLLTFSVLCKSLKCFKFLLLNGANPLEENFSRIHYNFNLDNFDYFSGAQEIHWKTMEYAAATGGIEFIKCLQDIRIPITHYALAAAALYHQNIIFNWILSTVNFSPLELKASLGSAIMWNNIEAVIGCINAGAKIYSSITDGSSFDDPKNIKFVQENSEIKEFFPFHFRPDIEWRNNMDDLDRSSEYLQMFNMAIYKGFDEIVGILLQIRQKINWNRKNYQSLLLAIHINSVKIVHLLLKEKTPIEGYNINEKDQKGEIGSDIPFILAVKKNNLGIIELLIKNGCDINSTNQQNENALHISISKGNFDLVQPLLDLGINFHLQTFKKENVLHLFCYQNSLEFVKLFVEKGININLQNWYGDTPLAIALSMQNQQIAQYLIDVGAKINTKNSHGMTPLLIAIEKNILNIALLLLQKGAKINDYNNNISGERICFSWKNLLCTLPSFKKMLNLLKPF